MDNNIPKWYIRRYKENANEINKGFNKILNKEEFFYAEGNSILNYPSTHIGTEYENFMNNTESYLLDKGYVKIEMSYFRQHILQIPSEDSKEIINNSYSIF